MDAGLGPWTRTTYVRVCATITVEYDDPRYHNIRIPSVSYDTTYRTKLKNIVLFTTVHDNSWPIPIIHAVSHGFTGFHADSPSILTVPDQKV